MSTINMNKNDLVQLITKMVMQELANKEVQIPIGVSGKHVHLNREDMDILFGKGSELTKIKDLKQPGQYASAEVVTIKGPKGSFEKVRVLGPLRPETQIEISLSDGFRLGVNAPIRESGDLAGTPGIELIGPAGTVKKDMGTITALRHIHMEPETAARLGLCDKQIVQVEMGDDAQRGVVFKNVLLRVSDKYALEMHVDQDEANAAGVKNGQFARIVK